MIDPTIKTRLGFSADTPDDELLRGVEGSPDTVCKPCSELKYCPYGPIVEDFPLLPTTRAEAENHNAYLRECLETGVMGSGEPLDVERSRGD